MRFKIIYKSVLLAIKGNDESYKEEGERKLKQYFIWEDSDNTQEKTILNSNSNNDMNNNNNNLVKSYLAVC